MISLFTFEVEMRRTIEVIKRVNIKGTTAGYITMIRYLSILLLIEPTRPRPLASPYPEIGEYGNHGRKKHLSEFRRE